MAERLLVVAPHLRIEVREARVWNVHDYARGREFTVEGPACRILLQATSPVDATGLVDDVIARGEATIEAAAACVCELTALGLLVSAPLTANAGLEEWRTKGWGPALYYYLTARGARMLEREAPNPKSVREQTLDSYGSTAPTFELAPLPHAIALPPPQPPQVGLREVLLKRRTFRGRKNLPVSLAALSDILWWSAERTRRSRQTSPARRRMDSDPYRAFEFYLVVANVESLVSGLYKYQVADHSLVPMRPGDFEGEIQRVAIGQRAAQGSVVLLLAARFDRHMHRYRQARAFGALMVNCARLAHLVILMAVAKGFRTYLTPALRDTDASQFLRAEPFEEEVLYLVSFG